MRHRQFDNRPTVTLYVEQQSRHAGQHIWLDAMKSILEDPTT